MCKIDKTPSFDGVYILVRDYKIIKRLSKIFCMLNDTLAKN